MIGIVFYNVGNLQNLKNALDYIGLESRIIDKPEDINSVDKVILPGVGAFGHAANSLKQSGFFDVLKERANEGIPLLGICVGMQLLFSFSEESGSHEGLDLIPGKVTRFQITEKVPHMGWNQVHFSEEMNPIFDGLENKGWAYFVHSYFCGPNQRDAAVGTTIYSEKFCSVVNSNNVYGVQFHPEKSQHFGLQLLKNFAGLKC